jgi:hypothetical protein
MTPDVPALPIVHGLKARALAAVYNPRPAPVVLPFPTRRAVLFDFVAKTIGDVPLTYLEFGVHQGVSMHMIGKLFTNPASRFHGFDSFEGLPESWGNKGPGHFSTEGAAPRMEDPRVTFIKGWFQNTLPQFLATEKPGGSVLVQFDADVYSATLFLLTTLWHHIPAYYFMFDEFVPSEVVAFYDFSLAYPVEVEFLAARSDEYAQPGQVFGRLRNTAYQPPMTTGP